MIYIYDILLNWSKDKLYNFFEWEKTDKITHIKRIPLFKVEKGVLGNFFYNKIKIDEDFVKKFFNLTEIYSTKKLERIKYACLISDGNVIIAIQTDKSGNVLLKSRLMVDEEEEILCISKKLVKTNIKIEVGEVIDNVDFFTRSERTIKKYLENSIEECYRLSDWEKLKYLYIEYFGNYLSNNYDMYTNLLNSLNCIDDKHKSLYKTLQLISNKN